MLAVTASAQQPPILRLPWTTNSDPAFARTGLEIPTAVAAQIVASNLTTLTHSTEISNALRTLILAATNQIGWDAIHGNTNAQFILDVRSSQTNAASSGGSGGSNSVLSLQTNGTLAVSTPLTNINLVAGANVTISVVSNAGNATVTIASSGSGGGGGSTNDFWNETMVVRSSTTMAGVGTTATIVNDAGASAGQSDGQLSSWEQLPVFFCTTGANANRNSSVFTSQMHAYGFPTRFIFAPGIPTLANRRMWIGLSSTNGAGILASDTPDGQYAAFRMSSSAGDTNWMAVVSDGSNLVVSNTGVFVDFDNSVSHAEINWGAIQSGVNFYLNGNLVASITNSMDTNALFGMFMGVRSITNLNVTVRSSYLRLLQNPIAP